MNNIQKLGGYASLLTGLGFMAILVIDFAVLAPQGFAGPDTPPDRVMALVANSAVPFQLLDVFSLLASITLILGALAVRERLDGAPTRMLLALIAASIASTLIIAVSAADFSSTPIIAAAHDVAVF